MSSLYRRSDGISPKDTGAPFLAIIAPVVANLPSPSEPLAIIRRLNAGVALEIPKAPCAAVTAMGPLTFRPMVVQTI
jgi:hypothetical protein